MDHQDPSRSGPLILLTFVTLGAVFAVLQTAVTVEFMSRLTKPLVTGLLRFAGWEAQDLGVTLLIGRLNVPWTGDCAGLNILAILWAVVLWSGRERPWGWEMAGRLVLALPVAFAANLARIFTLILYRAWQYPQVESPQLHYFFGFLWVLPVLRWFMMTGGGAGIRSGGWRWLEALHIAAVLATVASMNDGPAGWVVSGCALVLLLPRPRREAERAPADSVAVVAWLLAAVLIALMRMESLWLPWLLVCPVVQRWTWRSLAPLGLACVGTVPVLAWNPITATVGLVGAAWWIKEALRQPEATRAERPDMAWPMKVLVMLYLVLPFVASSLPAVVARPADLPAGAMVRRIEAHAHQVRLLEQSPAMSMVWYDPAGDGRHHTLVVCMRYRGIELHETSPGSGVLTDGSAWYRQYFLQGGDVIETYAEYLQRTSLPLSDPGTHVIMSGASAFWSEPAFARETGELAQRLVTASRR